MLSPRARLSVQLCISLSLGLAAFAGCDGVETNASSGSSSSSSGSPATCDAVTEPPAPSQDWCARVAPGAPGAHPQEIDLSAAHASVRFFGPVGAYSEADQALAAALDDPAAADLAGYAAALPGVACAAMAGTATALGPASVETSGSVAIVHPGTGAITLPAGVEGVAIDLRDLPNTPDLRAALEAAVSPALATPIERAVQRVRKHDGMVDELFSATNVYKQSVLERSQAPIPATGSADLPLAVLTNAVMAPEAAELAATLRLANRAWIIGESVRVEVAESRWHGIGSAGVANRVMDLGDDDLRWPDEIPADERMDHPECIAPDLLSLGAPPALTLGSPLRPSMKKLAPFGDTQPEELGLGDARAALIISHGAARTFFPYFATVGDHIDERLTETLGDLDAGALDRKSVRGALRRFGEALTDGHNFIFDYAGTSVGSFPVYVEDIAGEAVVRRSAAVGVNPGDTITSIGGVPAATWYATELARTSAATDGYRFNIASRRYMQLDGPIEFGLRDPDGNTKTITFQPQPLADLTNLGSAPSVRAAGPLTDLGAPDLYYINLAGDVLTSITAFRDALAEAEAAPAAGLVIDMRGYPGIDHYEVAQRLIQAPFSSPIFRTSVFSGPDEVTVDESSYMLNPLSDPSYAGPIVLLVGHASVSAAENFSTMLVDADRVKVIGRQSAGTNGNITGAQIPGAFGFSFTGMEVLHADAAKSQFHGIGIVPDTDVVLTAADFRDGVDPELEAAIAWLSMN